MNRYAYCPNNIVLELIPEFDENFPSIPITRRYSKEFLELCVFVPENTRVESGWIYDPETNTFSEPPDPESEPEKQEQS
jgi:hypothetical protein